MPTPEIIVEAPRDSSPSSSSYEATKSVSVPSVTIDLTHPIDATAACDSAEWGTWAPVENINQLAWGSAEIVRGLVTDVSEPQKIQLAGSLMPFLIARYATVQVTERYRGKGGDTILIRQMGGTIGNCSQRYPETAQLEKGEDVVLFLVMPYTEARSGELVVRNPEIGKWSVDSSGTVSTASTMFAKENSSLPLSTLVSIIADQLRKGPEFPNDPLFVPSKDAPLMINAEGTPAVP